ncbi:MAG: protein TusC [Lysobacteraceae bacterium]|nr:MAG: protein TusC [Xanthomonadaceae bacterium]
MSQPRPFLVLVDQLPMSGDDVRERVDLVIMALALDLPVQLLFVGDGVWQLKAGQSPDRVGLHDSTAAWRSLDLYGLDQIWVDGEAMRARGLQADQLMLPASVVDAEGLRRLMTECGSVL